MSRKTPEFPALTEMTEAIARRMLEVEHAELATEARSSRRRTRRVAGCALAALVLGVPTAAAVRSVLGPSAVPFQAPSLDPATGRVTAGDAVGYVVAEGVTASRFWTIALRRCERDGRTGLGLMTLISTEQPRTGGLSVGECPAADPQDDTKLKVPAPGTSRSRGLSLLYGVVPARATEVVVRAEAVPVNESGARGAAEAKTLRLTSAPLPAVAVNDGGLPSTYRVFASRSTDEDLRIVDVTALDAEGAAIMQCTAQACGESSK